MQKVYTLFRNGFKYMTILLALILLVGQVHSLMIERNQIEEYQNPKEVIVTEINECEKNYSYYIFTAIFKCSLAFLAGGLISDMKFIKFGVF